MRVSIRTCGLLVALLPLCAAVASAQTTIQAEAGTVGANTDPATAAQVRTPAQDSNVGGTPQGGSFVALQTGRLTLNTSAVAPGNYTLTLRFGNPFGLRYDFLTVDGTAVSNSTECGGTFTYPAATVWTEATVPVTITGATGTIVISACYGYTYFDSVTLTPVNQPVPGSAFSFEAESGTVGANTNPATPAQVRTPAQDPNVSGTPSGGSFVALQTGRLTVSTSTVPAGSYLLTLRYGSPFGTKFEFVTLDGTAVSNSAECGGTTTFATSTVWTETTLPVTVTGSTGTLVILACYGYTYFDSVTLTPRVTVNQTLDDVAGYRLLSAPVQGVTVGSLAGINLVQGVTGQYPSAADNLFVGYAGNAYVPAASATDPVVPGRGFFWLLYDRDITPDPASFGGGTSRSYALPARVLTATGGIVSTNNTQSFPLNASGFYMLGNPFAQAMTADGVTRTDGTGGTVQASLQLYDTASGTYQVAPRTSATTLATWQGFFVEATGGTSAAFTYLASARVGANPPVVGRNAGPAIALSLDGQTADGTAVHDRAAIVRFVDGASAGWDADDASKLVPPTAAHALVAVVGSRDGAAYRQAALSLPAGASEALVAVDFLATQAGTYTLAADLSALPEGWTAEIRDAATGATADLAAGYTFTSDATDWTGRFSVALHARGATAGEGGPAAERSLTAPAPNPAAHRTTLTLRLPAAERVTAVVVDALGRTVQTAFDGEAPAGADVAIAVDAARLAPGLYVVRVVGATFTETRRLVVVR